MAPPIIPGSPNPAGGAAAAHQTARTALHHREAVQDAAQSSALTQAVSQSLSQTQAQTAYRASPGGAGNDPTLNLLLNVLLGDAEPEKPFKAPQEPTDDTRLDTGVLSDDEEAKDDLGEVNDEAKHKRLMKEHNQSFRVEKVRQSLQMLTGEEGYQQIRDMARGLARHAASQDEPGLEKIRHGFQSLGPFERFAVARMAAASCDGSVRKSVDGLCDRLYERDHVSIRATVNTVSVISNQLPAREDVSNFCALYSELLETPQSPKSLIDALLNAPGGDVAASAKLLRAAARQDLQSEVPSVNRTSLTRMVGYLETMNLTQVASSVMALSTQFLKRYEAGVNKGSVSPQSLSLELVDFGAGNATGPKLDKLMTATLAVARPSKQQKLAYFNDLTRTLSSLPDLVWSADGSRDNLRKHLQKRLNDYQPPAPSR